MSGDGGQLTLTQVAVDARGDLDDLPAIQREDYVAVEVEGKSAGRQAQVREVATATVRKNVSRARQRLGEHEYGR